MCQNLGLQTIGVEVEVQAGRPLVALPVTTILAVYQPSEAPASVATDTPLAVGAWGLGADGSVLSNLAGHTLAVLSSDSQAILPDPVQLTAQHLGVYLWPQGALLRTPGPQVLQVVDQGEAGAAGRLLREEHFDVTTPDSLHLAVSVAPQSAEAGQPRTLRVRAVNGVGDQVASFGSRVRFASSDAAAVLPPLYRFGADTGGQADFVVTLNTPGEQDVEVVSVDAAILPVTASGLQVVPGPVDHVALQLPAGAFSGQALDAQLTFIDRLGHPTYQLSPPLTFVSSDPRASLPAVATYRAGTDGVVSLPGQVTLQTTGPQQVSLAWAAGAAAAGGSASVDVDAVPVQRLRVDGPARAVAGQPVDLRVTAVGEEDWVAQAYAGQVAFSASDPRATLVAPVTFNALALGQLEVRGAATFSQAGPQTVTVSDRLQPTISGTSAAINVVAAPAISLRLTAPSQARSLINFDLGVAAVDAFGNVDGGYTGAVSLAASDANALCPAGASLGPGAGGQVLLSGQVATASLGPSTFTANDLAGQLLPAVATVTTAPGPPSQTVIVPFTLTFWSHDSVWVGQPNVGFAVGLFDLFGNACVDYRGVARVDMGGHPATFSPSLIFDAAAAGQQQFSCTITAPGRVPLTITVPPAQAGDMPTVLTVPWLASHRPANLQPICGPISLGQPGLAPAVAFNSAGSPQIAWNTYINGSQIYLVSWSGSSWTQLGSSASIGGVSAGLAGTNDQPTVAIDAGSGQPIVAWRHLDPVSGMADIRARRWDLAARDWLPLGTSAAAGGLNGQTGVAQGAPSLAIWRGQPTVAFASAAAGSGPLQLWVLTFDGAAWSPMGSSSVISPPGGSHTSPSLAIDGSGAAAVAWSGTTGSSPPQILYSRFNGSSWAAVGGSLGATGISASAAAATEPRLTFDNASRPWVAWTDTGFSQALGLPPAGQILVATFDGQKWTGPARSALPTGVSLCRDAASQPDVGIAPNGDVVVVWRHTDLFGHTMPMLRRWTPGDATWREVLGSATACGANIGGPSETLGAVSPRVMFAGDGSTFFLHVTDVYNLFDLDRDYHQVQVSSWP